MKLRRDKNLKENAKTEPNASLYPALAADLIWAYKIKGFGTPRVRLTIILLRFHLYLEGKPVISAEVSSGITSVIAEENPPAGVEGEVIPPKNWEEETKIQHCN